MPLNLTPEELQRQIDATAKQIPADHRIGVIVTVRKVGDETVGDFRMITRIGQNWHAGAVLHVQKGYGPQYGGEIVWSM